MGFAMEPRDATQHIAHHTEPALPSLPVPCHAVRACGSKCIARKTRSRRALRKTCLQCKFIGCTSTQTQCDNTYFWRAY